MKSQFAWIGAVLLALVLVAQGEGVDDKYVHVYFLIREADGLNETGQTRQAVTKYLEAQAALKDLQAVYPGWNDKVINYRLGYIASKLEPLAVQAPAPSVPPKATVAESPAAAPLPDQVKQLRDEIARLTGQNALLEAKLKEALTAQPTARDPRELARAEEKIKQLEKERDLLKAGLDQEQSKSAKLGDRGGVDQLDRKSVV